MTSSDPGPVRWYLEDNIGILSVNNPPVNALSQPVRQGILDGLEVLNASGCQAIVLFCEGRTFFAGADIREFNHAPKEPHLPDVVKALNNNPVPIIAAMHGTTLGGGLEVAMACQYRTAKQDTRIGLPEVNLGLIPGAGGTQLLPRLLPLQDAVELITSGKHVAIEKFQDTALVHRIFNAVDQEELLENNINYALKHIDFKDLNYDKSPLPDLEGLALSVARSARGRQAPVTALEVIKKTLDLPLDAGMAIEREAFLTLKASSQSIALRHAFTAEKKAAKLNTEAEPVVVTHIGVVGGGTMGAGIATALLNAGYQVTLTEQNEAQADKARQTIVANLDKARQKGILSEQTYQQQKLALDTASELSALSDVQLVIEAIFEDLPLKIELFKALEKVCDKNCVFATNTSYLDLNKMAEVLDNKARLVGIHFFSPAHIMKLVEVVRTDYVSEPVLATAFAVAKKARKIPVLVGNCFGFAGNRMYTRYGREIQQMLLEGASVVDIDSAMRDFGMAMGPLEVQDLAGIDVGHRARSTQPFPAHDPGYFKVSAMLVERGNYGRKTGKGFYIYEDGKQLPNPDIDQQIADLASSLAIRQTTPDRESIKQRALLALVSEGHQLFNEGITERLSDLDVIWINGYGFPRYLGGPMHMAEQMNTDTLESSLAALQQEYGDKLWPTFRITKH
jgi:3-hydroxyacyl-CoA dehydrogenase